jgi:serine/threonine protein kinase
VCFLQEDAPDSWGSTPALLLAFPGAGAWEKWCNCLCFGGCLMNDFGDQADVSASLPKVRIVRPKSERMGTGPELRALKVAVLPEKRTQLLNDVFYLLMLSHPSIMRVYGVYDLRVTGEPGLGMLMDFKSGSDLATWIPDNGFQEWALKGIVEQITDALLYIHGLGILHRDIKPSNVFCERGEDGSMKACLSDFGLAAHAHDRIAIGQRCGSPGYVAPELFKNNWSESASDGTPAAIERILKTDMFSFGMLIYVVALGVNPFIASTQEETVHNNARGLLLDEQMSRKDHGDQLIKDQWSFEQVSRLSDELQDLLRKCTARCPDERCSIFDIADHPWFKMDIRALGFAGEDLCGNSVSWEAFEEASRRRG